MPDPDQLVEQPFGAVGAIAVANLTTSHHLFATPRRAAEPGFRANPDPGGSDPVTRAAAELALVTRAPPGYSRASPSVQMPQRALLLAVLVLLPLCPAPPARADALSTTGRPSPAEVFTLDEQFVSGTGQTTDFRWLPDGRLVVINKTGGVLVRPAAGGPLVSAGSFDVDTGSEKGLLGVAVHPDFATNGQLFFYYSAAASAGGTDDDRHRVVVRTLGSDSTLSPGETVLLHGLRGPANHDGGALDIGPDRLLYVGVGDTGCNSGQVPEPPYTPTNFYATCLADHPQTNGGGNGKILRIGLDGSIPATNPLVGATGVTACGSSCAAAISDGMLGTARAEIFAWGFRNPFRLWVDPLTGSVWVGDVGEISYEEVTIVRPGRHHGWPWREGGKGHPLATCRDVRIGTGAGGVAIRDGDCVDPVYYCRHANPALDPAVDPGCGSITGGQIVDSCTWPAPFRGKYVFGDNVTGALWLLTPTAARDGITGAREDFASISGAPVAIHTGRDDALYVAVLGDRIARIAPKSSESCTPTTSVPPTSVPPTITTVVTTTTAMSPASSTTTSTLRLTTTTAPDCASGGAGSCDDGDSCTRDACGPDGRCRHEPAPALDGVRCLCGRLPTTCEGVHVPSRIRNRFARGCGDLGRAAETSRPRRARTLLTRAASAFRRAASRTRATNPKRLGDACGSALEQLLLEATARTLALVP
jgi:glucose/arabinose dehydrogenase